MVDAKELSGSKIFLVEDSVDYIDIVVDTLGDVYDLIVTRKGDEAYDIAKKEQPDLILLDIVMKGTNGYDVCRKLKEDDETKSIPVIFLTGMTTGESKKTGFDMGAVDYITKPFEIEELKARVTNHLLVKKAQENLLMQKNILEKKVDERTFELMEASKKMEMSSLEAILRLSKAAEYRDDDTGNHVFRVGMYSAEIGKQLGIEPHNIKKLFYAAPMHDVGKIGIPDNILLKPGKLTEEEWEIMKQHSLMGVKILEGSSSEIINMAEIIARGHHEKWNGKGYPDGKKGNNIPIFCRIVAIADVFDALTTARPYKNPFSIEKSFAILKEERGEHFDPDVVDAFFVVENKISEIKEKYSDVKKFDSRIFWGMEL